MSKVILDPRKRELYEQSLVFDAALDAAGLAGLFHPEAGSFRIGALPAVTGRAAIHGFFEKFFSYGLFKRLEHEMETVRELPDVLIYEATAIYTRPDGSTLKSPYVNVVRHRDGLFADYRVYIDTHPLMSGGR